MDAGAGGDGNGGVLDDWVEDEMIDAGGDSMNEFDAVCLSHPLAICTIGLGAWDAHTCQHPQSLGSQ